MATLYGFNTFSCLWLRMFVDGQHLCLEQNDLKLTGQQGKIIHNIVIILVLYGKEGTFFIPSSILKKWPKMITRMSCLYVYMLMNMTAGMKCFI